MFRSYRRRLLTCTIAGLVLLAVFGGEAFGAATGKIAGTITDKETKQPVIGASVLVVGTSRGAQTDLDGKYTIFQVEPGTYTLRISHIEYRTVEVTDVAVKADITTEQSIQMEQTATEVEAVRVVGQKDKLEIKEVSNQVTITKEEIRTQPVTTVDELLTQVAGVVTNSQGEVFIRGGRAGEVSYIVDGVPLDDPLGASGAQMSLVSGSIQEFTVIKDGFDPEYGDALSGIVKLTTQTGSRDKTNFDFQYITDDFGNKDLNKYSRNNDYLRMALSGISLHAYTVVAGLGGRAITKASLRSLFEKALRDELEPLTFLDLNQAAIDRELAREQAQRRSGPSAENILRDLAGGGRSAL